MGMRGGGGGMKKDNNSVTCGMHRVTVQWGGDRGAEGGDEES